MGNSATKSYEPVIMTKTFLEEKIVNDLAVVEGLNASEMSKLVKMDGIESNLVLSLQLEHQGLLNIANLWKFTLLTKLEITNNFIEEIEGLDNLTNLHYLDLSFNCIKTIKCLNDLINLAYLNLSCNEIMMLENMDNLKQLETFLVRHNNIKSFVNVYYLSQFENLFCLGLSENPLMQDAETRKHVIAVLPQLKFLDFLMVTENELEEALSVYPKDLKVASKDKIGEDYSCEDHSSLWYRDPPDKEAFIDGLANGRGFQMLLESDKNFLLLHSYPPVSTIADDHETNLCKLFDEWHDQGKNYYKQLHEEKINFIKMVKEVQTFALSTAAEIKNSYIFFKEEIPKQLCLIYQKFLTSEQKDREVEKLKEECDKELLKTQKNLMNVSCMLLDLVFDLMKTFKHEMSLIIEKYLQDVHYLYEKIMEKDEKSIMQLKEFYFEMFDTGSNFELEIKNENGDIIELDPVFHTLLTKKDYVEMALKMALTMHSALLQDKLMKLKTSIQNYEEDTLNQVYENDVLVKHNEQIKSILVFCNKQKYIIDRLFLNNVIFKHYLGYS